MGLVMLCTLYLLQYTDRFAQTTTATLDVHDEALKAISLLEQELRQSDRASLYPSTSPAGVSFASCTDSAGHLQIDAPSRSLLWCRIICYYLDSQSNLVRKERDLSPPQATVPAPSSASSVATFASLSGAHRVVGRGITVLEITPTTTVKIKLKAIKRVFERDFAVTVETEVDLRN